MDKSKLDELEYFASLCLLDTELDDVMELPPGTIEKAKEDVDSEVGRAVRKGRLKTRCEHNESVLTSGRRHSSPAQTMVEAMLRKVDTQ